MSLEDLAARLDKQAAAIRILRKDRDSLIERIAALEAASPSSTPVQPSEASEPYAGPWVPRTTCLVCSQPKGEGRLDLLTCKPCGTERNTLVYGTSTDKAAITTGHCAECKAAKPKPSLSILCSACSASHKEWKKWHAAQR